MYGIDSNSSVASPPAPTALGTEGYFSDGDTGTGQDATVVDQDWLNMVQETLLKAVDAAGIAHSKTDYTQLFQALLAAASMTDVGAANALAVTPPVPLPAFSAIADGTMIWVTAANATTTATPTLTVSGGSPVTIVAPGGGGLASGAIAAAETVPLRKQGSNWVLLSALWRTAAPSTGGYLAWTSTTALTLSPVHDAMLWIDGTNYPIPAGLTLSNGGLSASAFYYVYAYASAGTIVLEASATGYTLAGNGIPQKSGDATRTLLGVLATDAASHFYFMGVASWFNPLMKTGKGRFSATRSTSATSFTELNSEIRVPFVSIAGRETELYANGELQNTGSAAASVYAAIAVDSTTAPLGDAGTGTFADVTPPEGGNLGLQDVEVLSEGAHYATLLAGTAAGSGTATCGGGSLSIGNTPTTLGVRIWG